MFNHEADKDIIMAPFRQATEEHCEHFDAGAIIEPFMETAEFLMDVLPKTEESVDALERLVESMNWALEAIGYNGDYDLDSESLIDEHAMSTLGLFNSMEDEPEFVEYDPAVVGEQHWDDDDNDWWIDGELEDDEQVYLNDLEDQFRCCKDCIGDTPMFQVNVHIDKLEINTE